MFLIYIFVIPYVGNGPIWSNEEFPPAKDECKTYWWAFLLMLNNFIGPNGRGVGVSILPFKKSNRIVL